MTQREEFEAWMQTRPGYPFAGQFANLMWAAWQAAKAKPPVNVAKLGKRLAELLDEDQFAECEQLLLGIGTAQAAQPVREPLPLPSVCDGKEQEAFEAFAISERHNMQTHPLHYLFLNGETNAARQAWKAAINYCQAAIKEQA